MRERPFREWGAVLGTWLLLVMRLAAEPAVVEPPYRPVAGEFPVLAKSRSYRGELVFVDHANRRGSLRVEGSNAFRFNKPQPFALLPYAVVRYHGAPADLRDIPLGTILHVRAYLPPDPQVSAVPVLPMNRRTDGTAPSENHVLLLEDEPSYCLREGSTWKLKEVQWKGHVGTILGCRDKEDTLSVDTSTRVWRGRECLRVAHLVTEGIWPAEGTKSLAGLSARLGLTWKPTLGGVFTRYHVADIWLDDEAMKEATLRQTEIHKAFIRARWVPGWVDAVDYGKAGRATVTVTLFGGLDPSLYADFKKGSAALMNGVENTLKHTEGGSAGPTQMAAAGTLLEVSRAVGDPPLGSSGIQLRFETDLITEGLRPKRIIRVRPRSWPDVHLPREEYLSDGTPDIEQRFPSPAIYPRY